uniref:glycoside hydrolase family 99-like domain-containing protein n=1 Tax=Faecalibacillus intestinalis TaxID=1982626 RepID=UPI003AB827B2
MSKVKIIANYLPQFHEIPENNKFWGKGYTDWVAVKKSKALFDGHDQPREPEEDRYYSLDQKDAIKWQAELARENGIYGFGIYHYWFSSDLQLLQKPAEIILKNKDIKINFMFIWDKW